MHELSIAQSIVDLAEEIAQKEKVDSIKSVELEIGALSGVVVDALEFALEMTIKDTKLEMTTINYQKIKGKVKCRECHFEFETNNLLAFCPKCKQANFEIVNGKQLRIKSLTV